MARPYRDRSRDDLIREAYNRREPVKNILVDFDLPGRGTLYRIIRRPNRKGASETSTRLTHSTTAPKY